MPFFKRVIMKFCHQDISKNKTGASNFKRIISRLPGESLKKNFFLVIAL